MEGGLALHVVVDVRLLVVVEQTSSPANLDLRRRGFQKPQIIGRTNRKMEARKALFIVHVHGEWRAQQFSLSCRCAVFHCSNVPLFCYCAVAQGQTQDSSGSCNK